MRFRPILCQSVGRLERHDDRDEDAEAEGSSDLLLLHGAVDADAGAQLRQLRDVDLLVMSKFPSEMSHSTRRKGLSTSLGQKLSGWVPRPGGAQAFLATIVAAFPDSCRMVTKKFTISLNTLLTQLLSADETFRRAGRAP